MPEFLNTIAKLAVLTFLLSSMVGIGLGLTLQQIATPLRNGKFVGSAVLANFIIAPLLAMGIARALTLDDAFANGILVLGLGAGAPFMPKIASLAGGDLALSAGLMVFLMIGTMIFLPMVLPFLITGAEVNPWEIIRVLGLLMLLPLLTGLIIRARREGLAERLRPSLERISSTAAILALVLILAIHLKGVQLLFGTGAIFAAMLFGGLTALAGWLLGGSAANGKAVLALGTGLRNVPAALIVSVQNFKDPNVAVMVIVTTLVGILILVPAAVQVGKFTRANGVASENR